MRDIDFIALCYSKDKWVRGSLVVKEGGHYIEVKKKGRELVRPNTVCQFTGFVTRWNQRIYEGCILRLHTKLVQDWDVIFKDGCFMLKSRTTVPEWRTFAEWKGAIENGAEVIGHVLDEELCITSDQ